MEMFFATLLLCSLLSSAAPAAPLTLASQALHLSLDPTSFAFTVSVDGGERLNDYTIQSFPRRILP